MGREIRKVARGWQHPKNEKGWWQPLYDEYYLDALNKWIAENELWVKGEHPDQAEYESAKETKFYAQWTNSGPDVDYYRHVRWTDEEACCYQYYETVSEGTPISPVFDTLQQLEDWLVSHEGHSRFASLVMLLL